MKLKAKYYMPGPFRVDEFEPTHAVVQGAATPDMDHEIIAMFTNPFYAEKFAESLDPRWRDGANLAVVVLSDWEVECDSLEHRQVPDERGPAERHIIREPERPVSAPQRPEREVTARTGTVTLRRGRPIRL